MRMLLGEILNQMNEAALVLSLFETVANPLVEPSSCASRLRSLYARCFVYALDAAGQLIRVLQEYDQLPSSARRQCKRYLSQFVAVRDLRNSLQHIEDRLRGLGRGGVPLPGPLIVLGGFIDNRFGSTTEDGRYVEIEMSNSVLAQACAIVEDLL